MKKITTAIVFAFALLNVNAGYAQEGEKAFKPYSHEGVSFKIIREATRSSNGELQVISPERFNCAQCKERLEFSRDTSIEFIPSGVKGSGVELAEHSGKVGTIHVMRPGFASRITFKN